MIVLDPVDSTSAAGMVTRAQQSDIPVISYDRLILDADLAAYAEFNSPEVGKQQGEALAKASTTTATRPARSSRSTATRRTTTRSCSRRARRRCSPRRASTWPRSTTRSTGCRRTPRRRWTRRSPRVGKDGFHGVLAANDGTAGGAIAALKAAGIDPTTVPVTGQDAELAGIQRVLAGEQYMTVYKPIKPLADERRGARGRGRQRRGPGELRRHQRRGGQRDRAGADGDHGHDPRVPGQRRRHGGQGRLLDGAGHLHEGSTRRPARTPESSSPRWIA